ncbi:MAG TPA: sigma-70 family RNA polymerase sigma factor [Anaerolineaceae bacterium]
MMDGADDNQLIELAKNGDREAFNELVCRHRVGVINVIYRMCGDPSLAEDAAQVAFIQVWKHLPGFTPRTTFKSWLYRIAINAALDGLRRNKPTVAIDYLPLASREEKVEIALEQQERMRMVRKAVHALPEACRAVIILREYEEQSYQEIATTLEIPIGTVMSRLAYARKLLAQRLNPVLEEA